MTTNELQESVDGSPSMYYVGIGASAGGLEALEAFFMHMPPDSGMAFIVIQHLSPDYKSMMVELLSKRTAMPVFRAEDGMLVEPGSVYLIPPKKNLSIFHGKLILTETDPSKGINLPIDLFFRSLADDQADKSIGIILSGTGSDGVRGIRAIKEAGGLILVQSEESARFDGMPRAAISTGLADFVLPPDEMPQKLLFLVRHAHSAKTDHPQALLSDEDGLARIFALLRDRTRVDFTFYKSSTVARRIERRMTFNQVDTLRDYVRLIEHHSSEALSLYRELLISVTSFFRDREVFDELEDKYLPELIRKADRGELRFWVAGCATGEEAYSLAILAREIMERLNIRVDIKIFATDIDRDAILRASNGMYPESIVSDLSSRLLNKYFHRKGDWYQVDRATREMVVFAQHNLIKDPPFTNIDLVSCRNLLIYLQPVLQYKVMELFNFSLNPQGILLLGTSETTGEMSELFELLHQKFKIYRCKGKRRPVGSIRDLQAPVEPRSKIAAPRFGVVQSPRVQEEERLLERLLQAVAGEFVPLTIVVNEQFEVLHILGNAESYLGLPSGKITNDVTKLAHKTLALPLATGLQKVFRSNEEVKYTNITFQSRESEKLVNMRIRMLPGKKGQEPLAVIFFEDTASLEGGTRANSGQIYDISQDAEQRIRDLEQELQFTRENLQATIEELETSNEELQATNEELLASNEELQSTNEELQSVNEELHTVNAEYQGKIFELTELTNDLDNLIASIHIGTLFLDENHEIRRFTPELQRIFMIMESDIGRPIQHLRHRLRNVDLMALIAEVSKSHEGRKIEVCTIENDWFLMRILPYYVGPGTASGLVITFVDINPLRSAQEALSSSKSQFQASETRFTQLFNTMAEGVVYQNARGEIISANPSAEKILGLTLDQLNGLTSIDPRWKAIREDGSDFPGEEHPSMVALRTGQAVLDVIMGVFNPQHNQTSWIRVNAIPLFESGDEKPSLVYATFDDISDTFDARRKLDHVELQIKQNRTFENLLLRVLPFGTAEIDADGTVLRTNQAWRELAHQQPDIFPFWQEGSNCLNRVAESANLYQEAVVEAITAVLKGAQRVPIAFPDRAQFHWSGWVFRIEEEGAVRAIVMVDGFSGPGHTREDNRG